MHPPRTLCELFQNRLQDPSNDVAYLRKVEGTYRPVRAGAVADRVRALATALRRAGVQPGDRVAIVAGTRLEWSLADYAILHCGAVTVPVYPTLQAAGARAILRDCEAMLAFAENAEQAAKLGTRSDLPHLQQVVLFEGAPAAGGGADIRPVTTLDAFEGRGVAEHDAEEFERVWRAVEPGDLATLIYTSGTTGQPKGVMLTHANLVANILSVLQRLPVGPEDVCLSFLPLSHVFERMAGHFLMWHAQVTIAFAEDIDHVPQNLAEVRPTVLVSVPRLYEKMHARVLATMAQAPRLRRTLFDWARAVGRRSVAAEQAGRRVTPWLALQRALADRLVFARLRGRLGGRLRTLVSGGAPLAPEIATFFHGAGLRILEGYGLTETSPVVCVNPPERPRIGTVGPPIDGVEVRLDTTGEILVRGPSVMQGYYNNPQATEKALAGGWFHTGDVGELDPDGYLRITDRLKDLIVTAGGKNVAPQPLEARLKASPLIGEVVLIGDRRKYLTALIVPHFVNLRAQKGAAAVGDPEVRRLYTEEVAALNRSLPSFEQIKRFVLLERELQITSDEITPTMKVRRRVVEKTYAALIESMYQDPPPRGVCIAAASSPGDPDVPLRLRSSSR